MRKVIFCGDAACESGFAKAAHAYLDVMRDTCDIDVIGLNYRGTPHDFPYRIWPASLGGDPLGINMINDLIDKIGPDVVVIMNDPWHFPHYTVRVHAVPVVGIIAVDGKNCRGSGLNGLRHAIFWTQFGLDEARLGGYTGPASVVPLGVDREIYRPMDKQLARRALKIRRDRVPDDAFIVGNVGRNQPRKRFDLTIAYFAEWVRLYKRDDAFLYLHISPTGDMGYDCAQLAEYFGVANRIIICEPSVWRGATEEGMALTYNALDVLVNTAQGEGWSLPTIEAMACGVPTIVPDWAALGEWPRDAAMLVPCTTMAVTTNHINVIGGVADARIFIDSIEQLYRDVHLRSTLRQRGLDLVSHECYGWRDIGQRVSTVIDAALGTTRLGVPTELTH